MKQRLHWFAMHGVVRAAAKRGPAVAIPRPACWPTRRCAPTRCRSTTSCAREVRWSAPR